MADARISVLSREVLRDGTGTISNASIAREVLRDGQATIRNAGAVREVLKSSQEIPYGPVQASITVVPAMSGGTGPSGILSLPVVVEPVLSGSHFSDIGDLVFLNFTGAYTAPAANLVVFNFGNATPLINTRRRSALPFSF